MTASDLSHGDAPVTSAPAAAEVVIPSRTPLQIATRRFFRHRLAVGGLIVIGLMLLMAIFAGVLAPYNPTAITPEFGAAPSSLHLLGTDAVGRDVLSRLIDGARVSLSVGIVAVSIYVTIGTVLGALAGYYGGWIDAVIMRLADIVLSFPSLLLILVLVAVVGSSIWNIMVVIGLLGWPPIARIVRGNFLSLREREFVEAARCLGVRNLRIVFRHILPNSVGPIVVAATFGAATAILTESALSFLGLGVQPPQASWGSLLNDAQSLTVLERAPWLWLPPGLFIMVSVLAINFVGDGLRDALDPRLVS